MYRMSKVNLDMFKPLLEAMRAKMLNEYGASESNVEFIISIIGASMVQVGEEVIAGAIDPERSHARLQVVAKERIDAIHEKFAGDSPEAVEMRKMLASYIYSSLKSEVS